MFQHWINAERFPVSQLCVNTLPATKITLITNGIQFCSLGFKGLIYRVIRKSLRDFRPLRYSSRDGHAEGEHVNRGRDTASFCPTLQLLVMCTLGDATDVKFWQIPRQTAYLFPVHAMFRHDCPPSGETCKYATAPSTNKTWRDSLSIDMLLCAVSVLVIAQSSSETPEGLMNNPVLV
jgi:hypothetical protein